MCCRFPRIRYSASWPTADEPVCCHSLLYRAPPAETSSAAQPTTLWKCPRCHGFMHLVERLSVAQLFFAQRKERNICLTLPSAQIIAVLIVCFAAHSLEVCLSLENSHFRPTFAAFRSGSPHGSRLVAENLHSIQRVSLTVSARPSE
jgi:hypothetical protein